MNATKPTELKEIRAEWERSLTALTVIKIEGHTVLVILKDKRGRYHCHRYFTIGDSWTCSVDGQGIPVEAVFSWLNHPSAMTTQQDNYILFGEPKYG